MVILNMTTNQWKFLQKIKGIKSLKQGSNLYVTATY